MQSGRVTKYRIVVIKKSRSGELGLLWDHLRTDEDELADPTTDLVDIAGQLEHVFLDAHFDALVPFLASCKKLIAVNDCTLYNEEDFEEDSDEDSPAVKFKKPLRALRLGSGERDQDGEYEPEMVEALLRRAKDVGMIDSKTRLFLAELSKSDCTGWGLEETCRGGRMNVQYSSGKLERAWDKRDGFKEAFWKFSRWVDRMQVREADSLYTKRRV